MVYSTNYEADYVTRLVGVPVSRMVCHCTMKARAHGTPGRVFNTRKKTLIGHTLIGQLYTEEVKQFINIPMHISVHHGWPVYSCCIQDLESSSNVNC